MQSLSDLWIAFWYKFPETRENVLKNLTIVIWTSRTNKDELQQKYYDELMQNSSIRQESSNQSMNGTNTFDQKIDEIYSTNQVSLKLHFSLVALFVIILDRINFFQFYLMIYVVLVLSMTFLVFTQTISFYTVCMRASKKLHNKVNPQEACLILIL